MLIGLDAGTSVVKATAFSSNGDVIGVASRPTRTLVPAPGRTEQDIEELIAAVGAVIRELARAARTTDDRTPSLLGITGQGDGLWLVDEAGRAVRRAILWSDARAVPIVNRWLVDGVVAAAFRRSANVIFAGAAAPLMVALREEEPESLARAATAAYCKDVIVQRLTGVRATDDSDASLPFLDPRTRRYDPHLIDLFGLTAWQHLLPPIDQSPRPARRLTEEGVALTGLPPETLVVSGPFDLCATMVGAGVDRVGDGLISLGTTLGCGVLTDRVVTDGPPAGMTLCLPRSDRWVRVMPAMVGTPSLAWVLALVGARTEDLDALLAESASGAGGLLCLPFLSAAGERAPFVDPDARGQVLGLTLETTKPQLVRAVCEGVAYAARHCLESAGLAATATVSICGGGVRSAAWRQILADVLQRPLVLARQPEVGARGAAMIALEAAGHPVDRGRWTRPDGRVEPRPANAAGYNAGYAFYLDRVAAGSGHWRVPLPTSTGNQTGSTAKR